MNKRFILVVSLLVASLLVLVACGSPLPPPASSGTGSRPASSSASSAKVSADAQKYAKLTGNASRGKSKFEGTCVSCHGPDAKGMPGLGKDLTTSAFTKGLSNPDFILFVTKGRSASDPANTTKVDMPPKGGNPALNDQDLADIVTYVRTLEKK